MVNKNIICVKNYKIKKTMKYIISRANCTFSDGSKRVIKYNENYASKENACNDIEVFRMSLKNMLNKSLSILGITVTSILLTYDELDGRK